MNMILFMAHPYAVLVFGFGLGMFTCFVMNQVSVLLLRAARARNKDRRP